MLKVYKSSIEAIIPEYATESSACFDIHACLMPHIPIKCRVWNNDEDILHVNEYGILIVPPMTRVLIPTGLIFDVPKNHSIRLHPRSGVAFKSAVTLINCEGVIDEDYIEPVYVALLNASNKPFQITHGDRVCQAEIVCDSRYPVVETKIKPNIKSNRRGGFGSTGV
jgi:dUTP pyrophosphatase